MDHQPRYRVIISYDGHCEIALEHLERPEAEAFARTYNRAVGAVDCRAFCQPQPSPPRPFHARFGGDPPACPTPTIDDVSVSSRQSPTQP